MTDQHATKIVGHNIVALNAAPDSSSGLISQLVMGVHVRVRATDGDFSRVVGEDRYEGWMRSQFLIGEERDLSDYPHTTIAPLIADVHSSPSASSQILTKLTVATPVVMDRHASGRDFVPILLPTGVTGYTHRANLSSSYEHDISLRNFPGGSQAGLGQHDRAKLIPHLLDAIVASSLRFIGTPYLWGGSTPFGIDCSGLTQLCYKIGGIMLLRDAYMQFDDKRFAPVKEANSLESSALSAGDLLFFRSREESAERNIVHVGIAIGDGSFIHAAGNGRGVIVTPCLNADWSSIYAGARRLLPDADLSIDSA